MLVIQRPNRGLRLRVIGVAAIAAETCVTVVHYTLRSTLEPIRPKQLRHLDLTANPRSGGSVSFRSYLSVPPEIHGARAVSPLHRREWFPSTQHHARFTCGGEPRHPAPEYIEQNIPNVNTD